MAKGTKTMTQWISKACIQMSSLTSELGCCVGWNKSLKPPESKTTTIAKSTRCCLRYYPETLCQLMQIELFQEQPHLLDSSLQSLIDPLAPFFLKALETGVTPKGQQCFKIMYHYTKIRGYKIPGKRPSFPY